MMLPLHKTRVNTISKMDILSVKKLEYGMEHKVVIGQKPQMLTLERKEYHWGKNITQVRTLLVLVQRG